MMIVISSLFSLSLSSFTLPCLSAAKTTPPLSFHKISFTPLPQEVLSTRASSTSYSVLLRASSTSCSFPSTRLFHFLLFPSSLQSISNAHTYTLLQYFYTTTSHEFHKLLRLSLVKLTAVRIQQQRQPFLFSCNSRLSSKY